MKGVLAMLAVATLGAYAAAAPTSTSAQASGSAQASSSAQVNSSGANASTSGSSAARGSASAKSGDHSASLNDGTQVNAALSKTLDAKRAKSGDPVEARTTQDVKQDGKVVLKRGTRLEGHVTQANARTKEQSQSQLGIAFDHAVLRNGHEIPFSATIQAVAAAQSALTTDSGSEMMGSTAEMGAASTGMAGGSSRGGGLVGGVASSANGATGAVVNTASSAPVGATAGAAGSLNGVVRSPGAVGGLTSTGRLTSNSSGVFGLQGLALDTAASSASQGSLIVSSTKNVRLEGGTQLLLSAAGQAQ